MNHFTNQSNGSQAARMYNGGAIIRRFALFPLMLLMLLLLPARMAAQAEASSSKYIATYESSTQTLTFKKFVGETLPENSAWVEDKQTVSDINNNLGNDTIKHIVFDKSFSTYTPTSLYGFFENPTSLETITGLEYLNTEKVTNMSRMFYRCASLTSLDVTHFNTANVTDMNCMFSECWSLTSLDVTHFNTANVTDMNCMFSECWSLTSLDVTHFNTEKVTNMSHMFNYCFSLTSLDVSNFNTAKVTNMSQMFFNCLNLTTIYASSKFVTTLVSESSNMFGLCRKLKGEEEWTKDKAADKTYAKIEGGYFSTMVRCPCVKYADGTLTFYNSFKDALGENEYELNSGANPPRWKKHNKEITKVVFETSFASAKPKSCYQWFYGCQNLKQIEGIKNLNTEMVTNMAYMFCQCTKLSSLDVSGFNTEMVTNMAYMFYYCYNLSSLDVSGFNTEKVRDMTGMFHNCQNLTLLDVTKFNTANVKSMEKMFYCCQNFTSLDVTNFNTANVTNMKGMFGKCDALLSLDVTNFNTKNVTNMKEMFQNCIALKTIYVGDKFVTDKVTDGSDMFLGCTKLKGATTEYSKDKTAHIFANYKTGYFTKLVGKNGDEKIGATGETLTADTLTLADDKDFVAYEPFAAKAASYSRPVKKGTTWATLCLPFGVSLANQNFRAFKLLSADEGTETVELEEIETSIAAGTPVIIKMKDGATKLNFTVANKEIANEVKTAETANGNYQFQGLYTQKVFSKDTDNNCYIVKGDKLMNPAKLLDKTETESVGSKPFRAYMVDKSSAPVAGARMFSIRIGEGTTAIKQLEADAADAADGKAEYYDLQGHRLQDLQKGVNIVKRGGKTMKVVIK